MKRISDVLESLESVVSRIARRPPKQPKLAASSSSTASKLIQINDHVFEVYAPENKRPSVEIVFFHGLQLTDSHEPHITTWMKPSESGLWLDSIADELPESRILTISYGAHTQESNVEVNLSMYETRENLLQALVGLKANIGQAGCPVILVGHCLGGLVMKELCLEATMKSAVSPDDRGSIAVNNFLNHVKGLFFFASPQHGTKLADRTRFAMSPLFKYVTTNNVDCARQHDLFQHLRKKKGWKTFCVNGGCPVELETFKGIVVPEASARSDVDSYFTVGAAHHLNVSRPISEQSTSFRLLVQFVSEAIKEEHSRCPETSLLDKSFGLQDQVDLVQIILKEAPRVAIVGMDGIGKTTLAKKLYNTISANFDFACFLEDVDNSDDQREKIKKCLCCHGRRVNDSFEWGELRGKSVLIVLDNVVSGSHVRVMTDSDGFALESRLIVTSRSRDFLSPLVFAFHCVTELSDFNSKTLLCLHAFNKPSPEAGFEDEVESVSQKCGGFPLALEVAGMWLRNRDKNFWDNALLKLSLSQPVNGTSERTDRLISVLEESYASVAKREQRMFLDVATFFHGESLNKAEKIWRMCGWAYPECTWTNLLERGLVKQVPFQHHEDFLDSFISEKHRFHLKDHVIQMHELLRNLGLNKNEDSQFASSRTEVWKSKYVQICDKKNRNVEVLKVVQRATEKTSLSSISRLPGLEYVRILSLDGGRLEGEFCMLPPRLVYLKIMHIHKWFDSGLDKSSSQEVKCPSLQYLEIESCENWKTLPSSLGQLKSLTHLTISKCSNLKDLSSISKLEALEHLTIEECCSLEVLPDSFKNLQALKHLRIHSCCRLKGLPDYLGQPNAMQHLEITDCKNLVLPQPLESIGRPEALQRLVVPLRSDDCENLRIPEAIWDLPALTHLDFTYRGDSCFPSFTLRLMRSLHYLKIAEDLAEDSLAKDIVTVVPDTFQMLEDLKLLWFRLAHGLRSIPELGCLQTLQVLLLEQCWHLRSLPDSLGELEALKFLHIEADALETLPNLGRLRALQVLRLDECWELRHLPDSLGTLQALRSLYICATWLDNLPNTLKSLVALEHLHISGSTRGKNHMKYLPEVLGELAGLKRLELIQFRCVISLPDSLGNLKSLQHLKLHGFDLLESLPDTLGNLHSLKKLEISNCCQLKALPTKAVQLQALKHLKIQNCPALKYDMGFINKNFRRDQKSGIDNWYRREVLP